MLPTWIVGYPEGNEHGTYLTLDIGDLAKKINIHLIIFRRH